ncbi:1655_t:CDS:1 [Funneliformis caledonium]|uniref:1655_t:CDS:1 n=1 Tax=Funneliformis caledonium TaxID=1117310 RepID=A0A9N9BBU3_9GLOM|nr:1655_t:CDS:1 [Funneliformis caledonium]
MPKHRSITVSLVDLSSIVEAFHYRSYSHYWWKTSTDKENVAFFPLHVGQKTKTCLNNHDFFVTIIVDNKNNTSQPGYLCQNDAYISQIENDPSKAISSIYAQIFENGTRFSGPLVLGWQDEDIIYQLLRDVLFVPISIFVDSLKIFVYGVRISSQENWLNAGPRYKSSFTYKFNGNKQAIYISKIEEDICILEIYQDNQMKKKFEGETPIAIWKKSEIKKYNGNQLFGLEHSFIQTLIRYYKAKLPTCFPKK